MAWTFFNSSGEALVQHAESEATQAEMEAQTAVAKFVPPDLVKHSPGVAKVFCSVNNGGVLKSGSLNVTSTARDATGVMTVTIATNFANTNFITQFTPLDTAAFVDCIRIDDTTRAAGSVECELLDSTPDPVDEGFECVCYGDQ